MVLNSIISHNSVGYIDEYLVTPTFIERNINNQYKKNNNSNIEKILTLSEIEKEYNDLIDDNLISTHYITFGYIGYEAPFL